MTSLYFAYVSLSTIGFGDYTVHSAASKVFTAVLLLWGTGEFATFVGQLASYHFDRFSYVHMRKLLELEHKGDFIAQLDNERDGTVSSGQFLAGYLVSGTRVKRFAFFFFIRVPFFIHFLCWRLLPPVTLLFPQHNRRRWAKCAQSPAKRFCANFVTSPWANATSMCIYSPLDARLSMRDARLAWWR